MSILSYLSSKRYTCQHFNCDNEAFIYRVDTIKGFFGIKRKERTAWYCGEHMGKHMDELTRIVHPNKSKKNPHEILF
jgi:hypothetical protein